MPVQLFTPPEGMDLAGQVSQAFRNVARGLAGAGTGFGDVVRLTIYVTDWNTEKMGELMAGTRGMTTHVRCIKPNRGQCRPQ